MNWMAGISPAFLVFQGWLFYLNFLFLTSIGMIYFLKSDKIWFWDGWTLA